MRKNSLGIDPGLHGAIALIFSGGVSLYDMPIYRKDKRSHIEVEDLYKMLKCLRKECEHVTIENVHSMPGQGVSSVFKFGKGFGIIIGICTALKYDIQYVSPHVWKKYYGLGKDKSQSVKLANDLYSLDIKKSKDGQAEALLIARYGKEKLWK